MLQVENILIAAHVAIPLALFSPASVDLSLFSKGLLGYRESVCIHSSLLQQVHTG